MRQRYELFVRYWLRKNRKYSAKIIYDDTGVYIDSDYFSFKQIDEAINNLGKGLR